MKTIGLLNFHYSNHNYGAVLQAYALQEIIYELGFENEHINYIPAESPQSILSIIKRNIIDVINFFDKNGIFSKYQKINNSDIFEDFRRLYLKRSKIIYSHQDELKHISNNYSHIIVGSDQVWRYSYTVENLFVYFLQFCNKNTKRIAYAASFGIDEWELENNHKVTKEISDELNKFSAISVRENTGLDICKNIFSLDATHVLDPTLTLNKEYFEKIANSADKKITYNKIVYYKLDKDNIFEKNLNLLENDLNSKSENIYTYKLKHKLYYNKVNNWLSKIKNCEIIITDSFHCICFAIIFKKEFICIQNSSRGNARLSSLLTMLNLQNRIMTNNFYDSYTKNKLLIDYDVVEKILNKERVKSINFLRNAIK